MRSQPSYHKSIEIGHQEVHENLCGYVAYGHPLKIMIAKQRFVGFDVFFPFCDVCIEYAMFFGAVENNGFSGTKHLI